MKITAEQHAAINRAATVLVRKAARKDEAHIRYLANTGDEKALRQVKKWDREDRARKVPRYLPDGSDVKTLDQMSALMLTDTKTAARYVVETPDLHPALYAEAKRVLFTNDDDKSGVAIMLLPTEDGQVWIGGAGEMATQPEDAHVTLGFFGDVSDDSIPDRDEMLATITDLAKRFGPFTANVSGFTRFVGKEQDVVVALIDAPELEDLRRALRDSPIGQYLNRQRGYIPHLTMGYIAKDDETPTYRVPDTPLVINRIQLGYGPKYNEVYLGDRPVKAMLLPTFVKKLKRHVRTPEGRARYRQPIGSLIVRDVNVGVFNDAPPMERSALPEKFEAGGPDLMLTFTKVKQEENRQQLFPGLAEYHAMTPKGFNIRIKRTYENGSWEAELSDADGVKLHSHYDRDLQVVAENITYRASLHENAGKHFVDLSKRRPPVGKWQQGTLSTWERQAPYNNQARWNLTGLPNGYQVYALQKLDGSFSVVHATGWGTQSKADHNIPEADIAAHLKMVEQRVKDAVKRDFGDHPPTRHPREEGTSFWDYSDGIYGVDWQWDNEVDEDRFDNDPEYRVQVGLSESTELGIKVTTTDVEYGIDPNTVEAINNMARTYENMYPGFTSLQSLYGLDGTMPKANAWNAIGYGDSPVKIGLNINLWSDNDGLQKFFQGKKNAVDIGWSGLESLDVVAEATGQEPWEVAMYHTLNHEFGHTVARIAFGEIGTMEEREKFIKHYKTEMIPILQKYGVIEEPEDQGDSAFSYFGGGVKVNKRRAIAHVSEYGSSSPHELHAEVWASYLLDQNPTEFVQEYGDAMSDLLVSFLSDRFPDKYEG
jgi:hypothetical protein